MLPTCLARIAVAQTDFQRDWLGKIGREERWFQRLGQSPAHRLDLLKWSGSDSASEASFPTNPQRAPRPVHPRSNSTSRRETRPLWHISPTYPLPSPCDRSLRWIRLPARPEHTRENPDHCLDSFPSKRSATSHPESKCPPNTTLAIATLVPVPVLHIQVYQAPRSRRNGKQHPLDPLEYESRFFSPIPNPQSRSRHKARSIHSMASSRDVRFLDGGHKRRYQQCRRYVAQDL